MAASALEEKINKIRQQNEEIRRRHEEVEEDKKNAAKLNALVQMVPSTDWPERKEPPEFSNPPKTNNKSKSAKEHHEHPQQYHSVSGEMRKIHTFAQGQGPPPDPKYNFLADAEREESNAEHTKDNPPNKGQKHSRGTFRRKPGGKDGIQRDYRANKGPYRPDEHQPEYEAWRAERNRIDEDRISRQRTAEGNWRREWDNDKAHIVNEVTRSETKLGDYVKKDHKDFDRRYHINGNDYVNHNRGGHRSYRGNQRHSHSNYESRSNNAFHQDGHVKNPLSSGSEERTVVATDKSIKVTLNQGNATKGPVMSVKVNSPSIAGTGRVGPRQRSRVTYSSHSDVEMASLDTESFSRPKSFEDKTKGIYYDNLQKSSNSRKSQLPPRKKDLSNKSPYFRKKEIKKEDANGSPQKYHEMDSLRKEYKDSQKSDQFKPQKLEEDTASLLQTNNAVTISNEKESNVIFLAESDLNNIEIKNKDNHNDHSRIHEEDEDNADEGDESILQNSDLLVPKIKMEIETCKISENGSDESHNVQTAAMPKCEIIETNVNTSLVKDIDNNDRNEIKFAVNLSSCDANDDAKKSVMENKEHNLPTEQTERILSNNCDSKQIEDTSEQEDNVKHDKVLKSSPKGKEVDDVIIASSNDVYSVEEQNSKLKSDDKALREKEREISVIKNEVIATDEEIDEKNAGDKQNVIKGTDETQKRTDNKKNVVANSIVVESPKEDLQIDEKKAASPSSKVVETEK